MYLSSNPVVALLYAVKPVPFVILLLFGLRERQKPLFAIIFTPIDEKQRIR